jgi:cupin superfamily acireductone dioxygenase involved in methionine salvage
MLINNNQISLIKDNKVCYIKNFVSLEKKYDFNLISLLLEEYDFKVGYKSNIGNLKDIFQIHKVSNSLKEFKTFFDFLSKLFKYERDSRDEVDLFFSLVSQIGNSHIDIEDVFILGLYGKTIYRIFDIENKDYEINKGDLIFIPNNTKHKVIGINPRIIASIGFYGKRFK